MKKKLTALFLAMLLSLVFAGMAQATYYHFEDYRNTDVFFTSGSSSTWTFDLDTDNLSLWKIAAVPLQNDGSDWSLIPPDRIGPMGETDILHRAYLTMRLCGANGDVADLMLDNLLLWNNRTLSTGGTGTIDVFSQLYDDHLLTVTIKSESGSFRVDWMNLAGCYESAPTTVPEPGTAVLLGAGLAGIAVVLRRRTKTAAGRS